MSDLSEQQLLGYLLGALDDEEQEWLDARLERDPRRRDELTRWRRRLGPLMALRPEFEPPPGLAQRTCRLVAVEGLARPAAARPRADCMTTDRSAPGRRGLAAWPDLIAVGVVLMVTFTLVLPAIDGSRMLSRVASCQNGLQQFGLALEQYGHTHREALSRLAGGGRLTTAGLFASELLKQGAAAANYRPPCPDAWLAAQAMNGWTSLHPRRPEIDGPESAEANSFFAVERPPRWDGSPAAEQPAANDPDSLVTDWPGTWRDGTIDGPRIEPLATAALLADAPSVDLPGQVLESHGGQGRNLFFEDGHVDFVGSGVRVQGSGVRVQGSGVRGQGSGVRDLLSLFSDGSR
jgi:hypothetical protein